MNTIIAHLQKYYGIYLLIIAVLFFILWFPNRAVNRYAICQGDWSGVWILDTRTSQLYFKGAEATINCGAIDKPIIEIIENRKIKSKEELIAETKAIQAELQVKLEAQKEKYREKYPWKTYEPNKNKLDFRPDTELDLQPYEEGNNLTIPEGFELEEMPKKQ